MEIRNPELLVQAARVAVDGRRVGVSQIQRKVRVGFARAARLLIELQDLGIVGEPDRSGWRDVLVGDEDARRIIGEYLERAGIGDGQ